MRWTKLEVNLLKEDYITKGEYDISKIKVIGNELDALRRDIKQPIGSKLIKKE